MFCPYNYLLDPSMSASMGLELQGAVLVLDEAIECCIQSLNPTLIITVTVTPTLTFT